MSTSEDAPLLGKAASSRRRRGAALAAVVLALAGGLAFAVADRSDTTTSLKILTVVDGIPASPSQDVTKAKGTSTKYRPEQIFSLSQHAVEPPGDKMMQLNSGLHGKVGSIEKWCGAASRRTIVASAARRRGVAPPAQASHCYRSSGRRVSPLLRVLYHSRRDMWHPVRCTRRSSSVLQEDVSSLRLTSLLRQAPGRRPALLRGRGFLRRRSALLL